VGQVANSCQPAANRPGRVTTLGRRVGIKEAMVCPTYGRVIWLGPEGVKVMTRAVAVAMFAAFVTRAAAPEFEAASVRPAPHDGLID